MLLRQPFPHKLPKRHTGRHRNVQRMLHAKLWYLYGAVAAVDGVLFYAGHFVAEDQRHFVSFVECYLLKAGTVFYLLQRIYSEAAGLQIVYGFRGSFEIVPGHGVFGAQCGFSYFFVRRMRRVAADVNAFEQKSICGYTALNTA